MWKLQVWIWFTFIFSTCVTSNQYFSNKWPSLGYSKSITELVQCLFYSHMFWKRIILIKWSENGYQTIMEHFLISHNSGKYYSLVLCLIVQICCYLPKKFWFSMIHSCSNSFVSSANKNCRFLKLVSLNAFAFRLLT